MTVRSPCSSTLMPLTLPVVTDGRQPPGPVRYSFAAATVSEGKQDGLAVISLAQASWSVPWAPRALSWAALSLALMAAAAETLAAVTCWSYADALATGVTHGGDVLALPPED